MLKKKEKKRRRLSADLSLSLDEGRLNQTSRGRREEALWQRRRRQRRVSLVFAGIALVFAFSRTTVPSRSIQQGGVVPVHGVADGQKRPRPTVFGNVSGTGLRLVLPAAKKKIIGIGYHQAYNQKALPIEPRMVLMPRATSRTVMSAAARERPVSFVMDARGRGSALTSSVDIAVEEGVRASAPIDGRVIAVRPYLLYGNQDDFRVDILADGHNDFKISIVHLIDPQVEKGQRVVAGVTEIGSVRQLGINSQIDQYLGQVTTHIHLQVNPLEGEELNFAKGAIVGD